MFFEAEDVVNSTTKYIPAVMLTEERMSVPLLNIRLQWSGLGFVIIVNLLCLKYPLANL